MQTGVGASALERFDSAIKALSTIKAKDSPTPEELRCLGLLAHIRRRLQQYHLDHDVYIVINECYLRGRRMINNGEEIQNPLAWTRKTGEFVIREMSRKPKGKSSTIFNSDTVDVHLETTPTNEKDPIDFAVENERSFTLKELLSKLKGDDGHILKLRWIDGLSWEEVAEMISQGGNFITAEAVKKRGQRALNKLKKQWPKETE